MKIVVITGSAGLIGSESVRFFHNKGLSVVGIDNDMRAYYFGEEGSTKWCLEKLKVKYNNYVHYNTDIRDSPNLDEIFNKYSSDIELIIHSAAQPSHDWAD